MTYETEATRGGRRLKPIEAPGIEEIRAARDRLAGIAVRTPLLRLELPDIPSAPVIHLKLENLQPIGSFKIRGALNAILRADRDAIERGVVTASAGNMAQGVAYVARRLGVPCTVIVPDEAPEVKTRAVERLGARVIRVPFGAWWRALEEHGHPNVDGFFVHSVCDPAVIAGNGTIGLEIAEELPDVDTILVPFGGGGLSGGIAVAARSVLPRARVFGCEVETAAPLRASLEAGAPVQVDHRPSFVDGIGGKGLLPEMWPLVRSALAGSIVVTLEETARAIRLLVERARVVAEGAGGVPLAAALSGRAGDGVVVCVVSGGNLDPAKLATILSGEVP
ncbi:MAG TPA: pyridoxal-phosphate dependent enzyme [Candidatus Eisenbacteria bacterium]|nr:pyridoxal-phosphate dependent enzyme [Candidatus Eisenbacteria bacterium]